MNKDNLIGKHIIVYDGICVLCNRSIMFVCRHDKDDQCRILQLQSQSSQAFLQAYSDTFDPTLLSSIALITHFGTSTEQFYTKSTAALKILSYCRGYGWLARLGLLWPAFIRDSIYYVIARCRYQLFGKLNQCSVPDPRYKHKLIL